MAAPTAILANPDDHRGILAMSEAVDAMLEAFRNWAKDPLVGELRRRTHTPKNVNYLHQGERRLTHDGDYDPRRAGANFGDKQNILAGGAGAGSCDSDTAALKLISRKCIPGAAQREQRRRDADSLRLNDRHRPSRAKNCAVAGLWRRDQPASSLALTCIRKS
jgi:hypothetical protein